MDFVNSLSEYLWFNQAFKACSLNCSLSFIPKCFFIHYFALYCVPLADIRSFWPGLLELLSDNDTRFSGYQATALPISFSPS